MKKLLLFFVFACSLCSYAQEASNEIKITPVDSEALSKIAKASGKKNTLFYTFGIWCEPCRLHLPNAIKLAKEHNLEFYVIIVDAQGTDKMIEAAAYLRNLDKDIKIAVLKDTVYGEKTKKRNKQFVGEITPKNLETIDDFSKYILLDSKGEVIMVTNYKDNKGNDWRDDSKMIEKTLVPLLQ